MQTRTFAKTGEKVSLLGFGCMRLPVLGGDMKAIDEPRAKQLIDEAWAAGVNYFDTAYNYHGGNSEAFVGRALADKPRDSFFVATKLPMWKVDSRERAAALFEEQRARLGLEVVDFYLLHALDDETMAKVEQFDLWGLLDELRREGKVGKMGFSFHGTAQGLETLCTNRQWDFVQIQYNYFDGMGFTDAQQQYDILEERRIPCIVMEPVRGGRLADLGGDANAVLQKANPIGSIASWAMRWLAPKANILTVLSGMTTPEQLRDNLETFADPKPLSPVEQKALQEAVEIFKEYAVVPCTACRYCMPCPAGVDIPGMLALYNKYAFDGGPLWLREGYREVPEEERAGNCVSCGKCNAACPQHLEVNEWMRKIASIAG